jgi:small ligand-binding sensory domain FIST
VGIGVAANNAEYFDEPGMAVMLCDVSPHDYRVFSGVAPLNAGFEAHMALVHADGRTPELTELLVELAERTSAGYLFGGVAASRTSCVQFAVASDSTLKGQGAARGVFEGGLSGVAFRENVGLVSRVTQGCQPVAATHRITEADGNLVLTLDHEPALDVLLRDLRLKVTFSSAATSTTDVQEALSVVRSTLVGLTEAESVKSVTERRLQHAGQLGDDVLVRHIIGLDPGRRGVAVAQWVEEGASLTFCQRHRDAARADLMRICAEIREELEPDRELLGAVYVSCSGRGGPHFGGDSAEMQIVRHALGDVPLVGFFAGGEIAGHALYGYTGVLTVFASAPQGAA